MNDKDKEAFDKWFKTTYLKDDLDWVAESAWQAACEYKQKELEQKLQDFEADWIKMRDIAEKLQAENEKLMLIAEYYANSDEVGAYARKILKELEQL